jgi:hypothetical protein
MISFSVKYGDLCAVDPWILRGNNTSFKYVGLGRTETATTRAR